jgi:hypothetical protein
MSVEPTELSVFDDFTPSYDERKLEHSFQHRQKYGSDGTKAAKADFRISEGETGDALYAMSWVNRDQNPETGRAKRHAAATRGLAIQPTVKRKFSSYEDKRKKIEARDKVQTKSPPRRNVTAEISMRFRMLVRSIGDLPEKSKKSFTDNIFKIHALFGKGIYSDETEWLFHEKLIDVLDNIYNAACDELKKKKMQTKMHNIYVEVAQTALDFSNEARLQNEYVSEEE